MALYSVKPLYSPSVTATNGSDTIQVTGNVNCSFIMSGSIVSIGGANRLADAVSGTGPNGSGNSTIKLRRPWAGATVSGPMLAFMSYEGLSDAVFQLKSLIDAAAASVEGAFSFMGNYDLAAAGALPTNPAEGAGSQMYRISTAAVIGSVSYLVGDLIYYDQYQTTWRKLTENLDARLGTTGNLGNAALAALTTSITDATPNRALKVGDNGIQLQRAFLHQIVAVPASTNLTINSYPRGATSLENGWAYTVQLTTSGTGVNTGAKYRIRQNGADVFQLLVVSDFTGTNQPRLSITSGNLLQVSQGGASTQTVHVAIDAVYVGNTTVISPYYFGLEGVIGFKNNGVPAFAVAGVPTHDLYYQNNILGTVSQSGGVPTGAIIQRGSNPNGEFVRFADGTQICWLNQTAGFSAPAAYGSGLYRSAKTVDYPAAFNSNSFITGGGWASDNAAEGWCVLRNSSASSGVLQYFTPTVSPSSREVRVTVFGRWS